MPDDPNLEKDRALLEMAGRLRASADLLEQLVGVSSILPPAPDVPRPISWHRQLLTKQISVPAAGGWMAGVLCAIEVLRAVLAYFATRTVH